MDTIFAITEWYEANSLILLPIFISIFVLGVSLGLFQAIGDRYIRLALLVPISAILLILSFFSGVYGAELFLNLSMQIFLTLLAVTIVSFATQVDSWFLPIVTVAIAAVLLQFLTPLNAIGSNIPTTLGTTLVGALMVAYMLRQEWAWSPVRQERRLSATMRQARKEQAEKDAAFGDFFMLIAGHDEAEIEQRIDFLKAHDMRIIRDTVPEYDEQSENFYRLVNVGINTVVKNQETVLLSNQEARIQMLGYPDTIKRLYKQYSEVIHPREQKRLESPDEQMVHLEFKADAPAKLYSAILEEKIYALAKDWQYGDDAVLQQATDELLEWAKLEGLIQK